MGFAKSLIAKSIKMIMGETKIDIIRDTREQLGFTFSMYNVNIINKKLDAGDYMVPGYSCVIERKNSISELYNNCFAKYKQFRNEMIKLSKLEKAYIICEFPFSHIMTFPKELNSRAKPKFSKTHIIDKINHIQDKYKVAFIFCNSREIAENTTYDILYDFYESKINEKTI